MKSATLCKPLHRTTTQNKQKLLVQVGVSFLNAAGVDCSCTATLRMYSHYIPKIGIANKLYKKNKLLYSPKNKTRTV